MENEEKTIITILNRVCKYTGLNGRLALFNHIYRDIIVYSFYLLRVKNKNIISYNELLDFVGIARDNVDDFDNALVAFEAYIENPVIEDGVITAFSFTKAFLDAAEPYLLGPGSTYRLDQPFHVTNGNQTTGIDIIDHINLNTANPNDALPMLLNLLDGSLNFTQQLPTNYKDYGIILRTGNPDDFEKGFIFGAFSSNETLDTNLIIQVYDFLNGEISGNTPYLAVLPSISGDIAGSINERGTAYVMWELNFIRFLHLLGDLIVAGHSAETLRWNFNQIFSRTTNQYGENIHAGLDGSFCYTEGQALVGLCNVLDVDVDNLLEVKKNQ